MCESSTGEPVSDDETSENATERGLSVVGERCCTMSAAGWPKYDVADEIARGDRGMAVGGLLLASLLRHLSSH